MSYLEKWIFLGYFFFPLTSHFIPSLMFSGFWFGLFFFNGLPLYVAISQEFLDSTFYQPGSQGYYYLL